MISLLKEWIREKVRNWNENQTALATRYIEKIRRGKEHFELKSHIRFRHLEIYPGTLAEYSQLKGLEYEIVDTGLQNKSISVQHWWRPGLYRECEFYPDCERDGQLYRRLLEEGVCGLIHVSWNWREIDGSSQGAFYSGVPVRIKKDIQLSRKEFEKLF